MNRNSALGLAASLATLALLMAARSLVRAQQPAQVPPGSQPIGISVADDEYLRWPLAASDQAYGTIDGKRLHRYVAEQAAISRRYRDQGHPKFWGRIIGTSSDQESAEWLAAKFKAAGLADVRIQRLDLEAVYIGLGSEADFAGKDVNGKAAVVFSMVGLKPEQAPKRADGKGAKAILSVDMLPGNMRFQEYPSGTNAPAFTVGSDDGYAMRDLIASAPAGQPARVKVSLGVMRVPNL